MACGVGLGILLIFLVQAEHACCSWATQAHSSWTHNGNGYVGFSNQDGRLRLGGGRSQNQFRQASFLPRSVQSSLNPGSAVNRGYSSGISNSYRQTVSEPAQSSARLVQGSLSGPSWHTNPKSVNARERPNLSYLGLSTAIASGSGRGDNQNRAADIGKKMTLPFQQGRPYSSNNLPGSSTSLMLPGGSYTLKPALYQSVAQKPASVAVLMQTSASARATKVSHKSDASTPLGTAAGRPYQTTRGHYAPASNVMRYEPSYTSTEQRPSSRNTLQASWSAKNPSQRACIYGSNTGTARLYDIPQRYGGSCIRRLGSLREKAVKPQTTSHQRERVVQKPQASLYQKLTTTTSPPKQMVYPNPASVYPEAKWMRLRPYQGQMQATLA